MNADNFVELLQKGFHVTLGATTSLVESVQDPQKREENLAKLQLEWSQLSEEWAEKGAVTEQEARRFVDTLLSRQSNSATSAPSSERPDSQATASPPTAPPDIQTELQELTAKIAAMRAELEQLRNSNSAS
jgi:polyhydroxyalkanoate synthesis regulator phasin